MNPYQPLFQLILILVIAALSIAGTFTSIFLERFFSARIQHRDGPGASPYSCAKQVFRDFEKIRLKRSDKSSLDRKLLITIWAILPVFFLIFLMGDLLPPRFDWAGLWLVLVILLFSIVLEGVMIHFADSDRERLDWREPILLKILGLSALFMSSIAVAMSAGGSDLVAISQFQLGLPFHAMLTSPGLFVMGFISFVSIYIIVGDVPIGGGAEKGLGGGDQYLIYFVRRMWSFALVVFWVFVFAGGFAAVVPKLIFPAKLFFFLVLYTLLQISVPYIRSSDAGILALRWLLMFSFIGFILEVLWVGFLT
jgi:hypothetical protein